MGNKPTIAISHLGCEKNRIDSEHMLGLLTEAGYQVDSDEALADYVIVNTCSFIGDARQESIDTLLDLAQADKKIIVTGCMVQHDFIQGNNLLDDLPEAVAAVGTGDYHKIVDVINQVEAGKRVREISANPTFIADEFLPRYRTTTEAVAYLRIAEGCDYGCAFCIIPQLRGKQRSRPIESIVAEAKQLASQGVQELILISQITTNYGLDLYGEPKLAELLRALGQVDIPWIRIHYAYPTGLTDKVLRAMQETPNVLPYLDLPLQHSHPEILKAMNRPAQGRVNDAIIERVKQAIPDAVLRTTFIVGFPGETDEYFEHLVQFVERHEFDHVGVFAFSPEEESSAFHLPDPVDPEVMEERRFHLMEEIQKPISTRKNRACLGQTVDVLIEQENPDQGLFMGRSARFAPDVDGVVYVLGDASLGSIIPVTIRDSDDYNLFNCHRSAVEEFLAEASPDDERVAAQLLY